MTKCRVGELIDKELLIAFFESIDYYIVVTASALYFPSRVELVYQKTGGGWIINPPKVINQASRLHGVSLCSNLRLKKARILVNKKKGFSPWSAKASGTPDAGTDLCWRSASSYDLSTSRIDKLFSTSGVSSTPHVFHFHLVTQRLAIRRYHTRKHHLRNPVRILRSHRTESEARLTDWRDYDGGDAPPPPLSSPTPTTGLVEEVTMVN